MSLEALKSYASRLGSDINLVQGAGGNVSYKDGDAMWVKASGTWLADADIKNIFVHVDLRTLKNDFYATNLKNLTCYIKGNSCLRPSIETLMHAIIDKKYVIHLHPVDILFYAVLRNGEKLLENILKGFNWLWVDYIKPGVGLAKSIADKDHYQTADVFILQNHGVIFAGNNIDEIDVLIEKTLTACFKPSRQANLANVKHKELNIPGMSKSSDAAINRLAFDETSQHFLKKNCFYPDQAVFLGLYNPLYDINFKLSGNFPYIVIPENGTYVSDAISQNALAMLKGHAILLGKISLSDEIHTLSDNQIDDLINWDAEKYRKSVEQ